MLLMRNYFTIPDKAAGLEDPRTAGNRHNFASSAQNDGNSSRHVVAPRFHLHHYAVMVKMVRMGLPPMGGSEGWVVSPSYPATQALAR